MSPIHDSGLSSTSSRGEYLNQYKVGGRGSHCAATLSGKLGTPSTIPCGLHYVGCSLWWNLGGLDNVA